MANPFRRKAATATSTAMASDTSVRNRIALWLIGLGAVGIIGASVAAIWLANDQTRPEMTRLVFASVVPLFGTWVGTVLAFYFARDNLQAATDSTVRLQAAMSGAQTPVSEVMIRKSSIKSMDVTDDSAAQSLTLKSIADQMTADKVKRMPILTSPGSVLYVVHLSTLAQFADRIKKDLATLGPEKLSDLLKEADLALLIRAFGIVRAGAVLAEARSAMNSVANCNDVFVTANGKPDEPVIGWITNTLLAGVQ